MTAHIESDIMQEFITELHETLERISINLTKLEKNSDDKDVIRVLYRDIHTIKGNSMMFGLPLLGSLNHAIENVLEPIRDHHLNIARSLMDALFKAIDTMNLIKASLKKEGKETHPEIDVESLIAVFNNELNTLQTEPLATEKTATTASVIDSNSMGFFEDEASPLAKTPSPMVAPIVTKNEPAKSEVENKVTIPPVSEKPDGKVTHEDINQETIRVNVSILDNFMNLVGELVLIRNQLAERVKSLSDEDHQISQRLNFVTSELQTEVMKTRMQPVGNVLTKFHRVIRDLSRDLGKKMELTIVGAETELDRALLDSIRDPLMHIVRNCADHGIESPEQRAKSGKAESGHIRISAYHEGGQVKIEVADDGKGFDPEKISRKALEKGLITPEKQRSLTEQDIFALVFLPGFSTAEAISNVSGRGVGMDVVKTNIERIGGSVKLKSTLGKGTTTILEIPLTLAIMQALLIKSNSQCFAIPQSNLVELIQIDLENPNGIRLEMIEDRPVFRLRGTLIPLIILNLLLKKSGGEKSYLDDFTRSNSLLNIVILKADNVVFGLLVDQIEDSLDIVVKPLSQILSSIPIFSGATILGDGNVALNLDIAGIAELSNMKGAEGNKNIIERTNGETNGLTTDQVDYLAVNLGRTENYVIPLVHVHRLEEIPVTNLQKSGDLTVCRYRDGLLPIVSIREMLGQPIPQKENHQFVSLIVVNRGERFFGLEVDSIYDIFTSTSEMDASLRDRSGIAGGFIHRDLVYSIIDVYEIIDEFFKRYHKNEATVKSNGQEYKTRARKAHHILLAEDNNFFRKQISSALETAGFEVTHFEDGAKAWSGLEKSSDKQFSIVVSDIEMPEMNGYEFAKNIRESPRFKNLPIVAVTSKFADADIKKGMKIGFNRYLQKLNKEQLIEEIDSLLKISA